MTLSNKSKRLKSILIWDNILFFSSEDSPINNVLLSFINWVVSSNKLLISHICSVDSRGNFSLAIDVNFSNANEVDIVNNTISYDIEKELGIEIVGDAKVRIAVDEEEDEWDEIIDEKEEEDLMEEIDKGVNENFINETDNNE